MGASFLDARWLAVERQSMKERAEAAEKRLEGALKLGVRHPRPSESNKYRAHVRTIEELDELLEETDRR